jgi:hypothetical protein
MDSRRESRPRPLLHHRRTPTGRADRPDRAGSPSDRSRAPIGRLPPDRHPAPPLPFHPGPGEDRDILGEIFSVQATANTSVILTISISKCMRTRNQQISPSPGRAPKSTAGEGSVTRWLGDLKSGGDAAARRLWERYFDRPVYLARRELRAGPGPGAAEDEEEGPRRFRQLLPQRRYPRSTTATTCGAARGDRRPQGARPAPPHEARVRAACGRVGPGGRMGAEAGAGPDRFAGAEVAAMITEEYGRFR